MVGMDTVGRGGCGMGGWGVGLVIPLSRIPIHDS